MLSIVEISDKTFGSFIFLFNLMIAGNYLGTLFPCRIQKMFSENPIFQNFIGYFTMYFFVTLAYNKNMSPWKALTLTGFIYTFFLIAKNSDFNYYFIALFIFFIIAIANNFHNYYQNKLNSYPIGNKIIQKIPTGIKWATRIAILVIIIGFIIYVGKKKDEYGNKFDMINFFFNSNKCNFDQIIEDKSQIEYFVKGLKTLFSIK